MKPSKELQEEWAKNPRYWKLGGLFYFNREDDRLLVDKPNPTYGTTFNFAHKQSYLYLLLIFSFFGFIVFMVTRNH
ncbi:hypothetical protein IVB69_00620 [Flavobacterium sp. J49]|uniref:hypothetical protein n=1 Tax=Flavobacterium sp. J49 TaxID=2718534 RepID=UPI00159426BD|nr:hypothetical protein [Flavobacterium sp. J49]MBF6639970.1 hypothetical protein [Flavobacterium sp. J49]NIC01215.1 hypothetical protein [Flavobacterium sp. J49]